MVMNIEKESSKFIKPFVPTPPSLRHYKISVIDELAPSINVSVVLFFSANDNQTPKFLARLEKSLEKTLTQFYPLAGRYNDETMTIDCNDQGAEFIRAKVNIKLQDILSPQANVMIVDEFIPSKKFAVLQATNPLLLTQVTMFECGGIALGVSSTHKIVDASTLSTFINEWAAMNREETEIELTGPRFNSSALFSGRCLSPLPLQAILDDTSSKYIRKKLSFSESAILKMKEKAITNGNISTHHLSKVQMISAIIWKAFIVVDSVTNNNATTSSILVQPVNLRGKTASFIPKNSCGNLFAFCTTEGDIFNTPEELADRLTHNVKKTMSNLSNVDHCSEQGQTLVLNSFKLNSPDLVMLTSWCKFPFYEADFGFGKPTWAAPECISMKNSACLMDDAQGNGVDAHFYLEVKDATLFEQALDVISFST